MLNRQREVRLTEDRPSLTWTIERIRPDKKEALDDHVLLEEPLEIVVNGKRIALLMRMPGQEKELAAGFCISEGYVRRAQDILLIHHCGLGLPAPGEQETGDPPQSRDRVEISIASQGFVLPEGPDVLRLIRSGCGAADVSELSETLPVLPDTFSVPSSLLLGLGKAMRDLQTVHHEVGGTHAAALFDAAAQPIHVAEDIGRHNAVDKVLGYCLLRKIRLDDKILVTSGRASYEMAAKAIRVGIPIIATISAPTSLAVQIAQDRRLTLVGYLRGGRMNLYTHPHRLRQD
ncbi:MAG: formate dehydrogenase accessory sulfurtransferase FdhD [Desulfobacteraceae bacterium]|jgi:FdhD protein